MKAFLIIAACTLLSIFANAKDAQPAEKLCDENIGGSYVIKYSSFMRFSHFATTTVEKGVADLEKRTCTYKVTNQLIQDELDWLMSDSLPEGKHQPKSKGFSGVLQGVQYIQMTNVKTGLDSQGQQPYATGELKILDEAKKAASGFDG